MGVGRRHAGGIGFGMLVTASTISITVTVFATFTALTTFALTVSGRDVVPWSLLGVVGGRIVRMFGVGNERVVGLGSRCIHLRLLISILGSACGEVRVRISMYIHVPAPIARALIPSSIAVTSGSVVTPSARTLASAPRDTGTRAGSRRPRTRARVETIRAGFCLEVTSNAWVHECLPPTPPALPLLFSVRPPASIRTVRGRNGWGVHRKRWLDSWRLARL